MESRASSNKTEVASLNAFESSPRRFAWHLLRKVWADTLTNDCLDLAAQASFYFVLSLVPFFLVIAAVLGWLPSTDLWHNFAQWITDYLPRDAQRLVFATILDLTQGHTRFFSLGLLTMLWTSSSGFVSLMESLSVAYGVEETRSFLKKRTIAICATVVGGAFAIASFGLLAFGHWIAQAISFRLDSVRVPWEIARWVATLALMFLGLALLNYFLPDGHRPWRWITTGTSVVALTYITASAGFNFYLRHFNSYPRLYGTLAGFIILMTWIYMSNVILLIGAETDHALDQMKGCRPAA